MNDVTGDLRVQSSRGQLTVTSAIGQYEFKRHASPDQSSSFVRAPLPCTAPANPGALSLDIPITNSDSTNSLTSLSLAPPPPLQRLPSYPGCDGGDYTPSEVSKRELSPIDTRPSTDNSTYQIVCSHPESYVWERSDESGFLLLFSDSFTEALRDHRSGKFIC